MTITKERAIKILSGDPDERRPTLLRLFRQSTKHPWQFWVDYAEKPDAIPNVNGWSQEAVIKVLATWVANTPNGNALLETYRHNYQKE